MPALPDFPDFPYRTATASCQRALHAGGRPRPVQGAGMIALMIVLGLVVPLATVAAYSGARGFVLRRDKRTTLTIGCLGVVLLLASGLGCLSVGHYFPEETGADANGPQPPTETRKGAALTPEIAKQLAAAKAWREYVSTGQLAKVTNEKGESVDYAPPRDALYARDYEMQRTAERRIRLEDARWAGGILLVMTVVAPIAGAGVGVYRQGQRRLIRPEKRRSSTTRS